MRIGIIGLLHESNTFVPNATTLEDFQDNTLLEGPAVLDHFANSHHEMGGFIRALTAEAKTQPLEVVPVFAARTLPSGTIEADAFQALLSRLECAVEHCGDLDGVLVAPHGATVSRKFPDADGHWLTWLRRRMGPQTPIVGTLDLHANLSPTMVNCCDALIAYRSNPHLDQASRGAEAAELLVRILRDEVRPTMAACYPPIAIGIEAQDPSTSACGELFELAERQREQPRVLSNSLLLGFPYADVVEMGSASLVVTNDDTVLAQQLADELGTAMWERRDRLIGQLMSVDEAMTRCQSVAGSVCLLDMGDNVGGGSAADGTVLARALQDHRLPASFVCLFDPTAVQAAISAGPGNPFHQSVGGGTDQLHGKPLQIRGQVQSLHDGKFQEVQVRHGGMRDFDQGPTAVVETESGLTVMLTSRRMVPFSLEQLRSCGLDPRSFRILVAKGVHAPVAAYAEVCDQMIRVNTPGSTCADMTQLDFRRRRRPLFPFESEMTWPS